LLDFSVLLALSALLLYGFTQVISKYAVQSVKAVTMVAVNFVVSMPIYIAFLAGTLFIIDTHDLPLEYLVFGIIGAATARGGYYLFLEALEHGSVTMVGSITAAYPAIIALLAVTVLGEELGVLNGLGISVIIVSMIALFYAHGNSSEGTGFSRTTLVLSVATLLLWGFGGIFIKLSLTGIPLVAYLGLYPFVIPPIALAYLRRKKATKAVFLPKWTVPVICAVMVVELWQLGYFAETAAVSEGAAAIVFPIISAYPAVTIIAAHVFLKESMSRTDLLLIAAVILGIVLTSIG